MDSVYWLWVISLSAVSAVLAVFLVILDGVLNGAAEKPRYVDAYPEQPMLNPPSKRSQPVIEPIELIATWWVR